MRLRPQTPRLPQTHKLYDGSSVAGLTGINWRADCTLGFVSNGRPWDIAVEFVVVKDGTAATVRASIYDVVAGSFTSAKTPPEGLQALTAVAASGSTILRAFSRTVAPAGTMLYFQPGYQGGGGTFTMAGCVITATEVL